MKLGGASVKNFSMKKLILLFIVVTIAAGCGKNVAPKVHFTNDVLLKMTPVKNARTSELSWAYAMLATIETERLMLGDSVNLSPDYIVRLFLKEQTERRHMARGGQEISPEGTGMTALRLLTRKGVIAFDSYRVHPNANFNLIARKLSFMADASWAHRGRLGDLQTEVDNMLDSKISPAPQFVFMYGCEYTPLQFAQSVCKIDNFLPIASNADYPFGQSFVLETASNYYKDAYLNLPVDALIDTVEYAVRTGHAVYWEGYATKTGFSFKEGTARLEDEGGQITREKRQSTLKKNMKKSSQALCIVGLAIDNKGKKHFICKNSLGIKNPYRGLMYMSFNYARLNTLSVIVPKES